MKLPKYSIKTLIALTAFAGLMAWLIFVRLDPLYGLSKEQYDQGYVTAFKMNGTGRGHIDYTREFWSAQVGFDDGVSDFRLIYEHPNVGPFSYDWTERLRDVIEHIRKSNGVKPYLKNRILAEMEEQLEEMEKADAEESGEDRE